VRFGTVGGRFVLVDADRALDVEAASHGALPADPLLALSRWEDVCSWATTAELSGAAPAGEFGPPVPAPRQVFAVALNYRPHAAEAGYAPPEAPLVFTKFPSCIAGPDIEVHLPEGKVDWEIEIVAIIGRGGSNIALEQGWDAIAGLTVGQDISERVLQLAGKPAQFSLGKSYPGFGPIGPVGVSPDEFPDRDDIGFEATLEGERIQQGRSSQMIFSIPELVSRLSAVCELFPGDLIFTGTPAGVGNRLDPPRYLQAGETLVSRVDNIGEIRQHFVR
jgi:2-keto-4-pentenoate hydratase/2-oxohepta-3-ene-1,7-dioic acid hydratase in catechol pathway